MSPFRTTVALTEALWAQWRLQLRDQDFAGVQRLTAFEELALIVAATKCKKVPDLQDTVLVHLLEEAEEAKRTWSNFQAAMLGLTPLGLIETTNKELQRH
jgi:hypothetical protein